MYSKLRRYATLYLVYFLSRILVAEFSSLSEETYLHGSSDVKFCIATFQKKNMIGKTSFF